MRVLGPCDDTYTQINPTAALRICYSVYEVWRVLCKQLMCAGSPDEAAKLVQLNLIAPMQLTILLAPQLCKRYVQCPEGIFLIVLSKCGVYMCIAS